MSTSEPVARSTDEGVPTHHCKVCGCLWILYPANPWAPKDNPGRNAWWSLGTNEKCGPCCDNVAMGGQIETLAAAYNGVLQRALFPPIIARSPERNVLRLLIGRKISVQKACDWLRHYIRDGVEDPLS